MWIEIEIDVAAPVEKVWDAWTNPKSIIHWNFADGSWHCPSASVDLRVGGKINSRMEAKDGSMGFDFWGIFTAIQSCQNLEIELGDQRKVVVEFSETATGTLVKEKFETEDVHSAELQREGWLSILKNFKTYVENQVN